MYRERTYVAAFAVVVSGRCCSGQSSCNCVLVVDGGQSMGLVRKVTDRAEIRTHPVDSGRGSNAFDDDIAALSNSQGYDVCSVRFDWYKIIRNNGHVVTVNGETLDTFGTAVDKPQAHLLSRMELEFGETGIGCTLLTICDERAIVVHLAVDEIVVREKRSACNCRHDLFDNLKIFCMIPIAKQDRPEIIIIGNVRWTVDNHSASQTSSVLRAVVRVIPRCAIEIRKE